MKKNRVLVVAAHADDEILGVGATIARHKAEGDDVGVMFLTDGVGARGTQEASEAKQRSEACQRALKIVGVSQCWFHDLPDNALDTVGILSVTKLIEAVANQFKPTIIYTHHAGDLNVDHRITAISVLTAFRPFPGQEVREIYSFEVPSATDWGHGALAPFVPTHFVDVTDTYALKEAALKEYEQEMRPSPHTRSFENLRALATTRGHSVGVALAEAFITLRRLV
jgi:LmbE family N-acetylglucosaminyl deacetylase